MSHHSSHDSHELGHVLPQKVYFIVLFWLFVLTGLTVALAKIDFLRDAINSVNNLNIVVALLIASTKAVIVAMFFMHLKYEKPMIWLYAFFPILLLVFLFGGVFLDNPFRGDPKTGRSWKAEMQERAKERKAAAEKQREATGTHTPPAHH